MAVCCFWTVSLSVCPAAHPSVSILLVTLHMSVWAGGGGGDGGGAGGVGRAGGVGVGSLGGYSNNGETNVCGYSKTDFCLDSCDEGSCNRFWKSFANSCIFNTCLAKKLLFKRCWKGNNPQSDDAAKRWKIRFSCFTWKKKKQCISFKNVKDL